MQSVCLLLDYLWPINSLSGGGAGSIDISVLVFYFLILNVLPN